MKDSCSSSVFLCFMAFRLPPEWWGTCMLTSRKSIYKYNNPGGKFGGRSGGQFGLLVRPVQSYNSPVEHRFLIGLDWSTNSPLPDCDCKYVSVRTMPPGNSPLHDPVLAINQAVSRTCLSNESTGKKGLICAESETPQTLRLHVVFVDKVCGASGWLRKTGSKWAGLRKGELSLITVPHNRISNWLSMLLLRWSQRVVSDIFRSQS